MVERSWQPYLHSSEIDGASAKSALQEWAQGRGRPLPRYTEIAREGPDPAPRFTAEVAIDGIAPEQGQGATKQAAEQAAALAMLRRVGVWQSGTDG
jgi:ribonuclease-3